MLIPRFAHEVYVLTPEQVAHDHHGQPVNVWQTLSSSHNLKIFALFSLLTLASLGSALFLKSTKPFQKIGKLIDKATVFAPDLIRVAFGVSLLVSAKNHAVFGPELPLDIFPHAAVLKAVMVVTGIALTLGVFIRYFGLLAIGLWLFAAANQGWYMLTYINYLGEAIAVLLLSRQVFSLDFLIAKLRGVKLKSQKFEAYSMPAARILFGFSLLYAAINVKFVTSALSLDVVNRYHLSNYFPFDPLFIVFGAGMVECLIAGLYMLGLLQRLNSLLFIGFLTASLLFFKESVWPHYLLIALAAGIFLHKPDRLALDGRLFKSKK